MPIKELSAKKKRTTNDTELSILGIETDRFPSLTTFPTHFNKEGFQLWGELLNSDWYADLKRNATSTTDVWFAVIKAFMKECSKEGLFPFNQSTQSSNNDIAMSFLNSSRIRLKKFFDHVELFKKVRILKVSREYEFRPHSFTVHNIAVMRPLNDPTFEKWLLQAPTPRFTYMGQGEFHKSIQANIDVVVTVKNKNRVVVKYSIFCHTPLAVPEYSKLPTKARLTQFAEKTIWLPVVRAHRFEDIGGRLF